MRKEEFAEVLGDINENYVKEARAPKKAKKHSWIKWCAMAACLCLVVVGAFIAPDLRREPDGAGVQQGGIPGTNITQSGSNNETTQLGRTNLLVVNEAESVMSSDMDVQITSFDKLPYDVWNEVLEDFHVFAGIGYEDFVAKIPNTWEYANFYSLSTRGYKDANLKDEYRLHDYVFECQTKTGGTATIALCSFDEPLRDCFILCDNPENSEINGVEVIVYGYQDSYMVQFSYENVSYDIETSNITLEELEELLTGIIG